MGFPEIAIDPWGHGLAVWPQTGPGGGDLWSARFLRFAGWQDSSLVSIENATTSLRPALTLDSQGNGLLAWIHANPSVGYEVQSRPYRADSGWQPGRVVGTSSVSTFLHPAVAISDDGHSFIAWESLNQVWAAVKPPAGAWSGNTRLDNFSGVHIDPPSLSIAPDGTALVAWNQFSGSQHDVVATWYRPATGWGGRVTLEGSSDDGFYVATAVTAARDGLVAWTQSNGTGYRVTASRFESDTGNWSNPLRLQNLTSGDGSWPTAAALAPRDFVLIWTEYHGPQNDVTAIFNKFENTTAPALSVGTPVNNSTTTVSTVTVSGQADPTVSVYIGGIQAAVSPNGSFSGRFSLMDGANDIIVEARDCLGNVARLQLRVVYDNRLPAIEAGLSALDTEIARLADRANNTDGLVDSVWSLLNNSRANVSALASLIDVMSNETNQLGAGLAQAWVSINGSAQLLADLRAQLAALDLELHNYANASQNSSVALWTVYNETAARVDLVEHSLLNSTLNATSLAQRLAELEGEIAALRNASDSAQARVDAIERERNQQSQSLNETGQALNETRAQVSELNEQVAGFNSYLTALVVAVLILGGTAAVQFVTRRRAIRQSRTVDGRKAPESNQRDDRR